MLDSTLETVAEYGFSFLSDGMESLYRVQIMDRKLLHCASAAYKPMKSLSHLLNVQTDRHPSLCPMLYEYHGLLTNYRIANTCRCCYILSTSPLHFCMKGVELVDLIVHLTPSDMMMGAEYEWSFLILYCIKICHVCFFYRQLSSFSLSGL